MAIQTFAEQFSDIHQECLALAYEEERQIIKSQFPRYSEERRKALADLYDDYYGEDDAY